MSGEDVIAASDSANVLSGSTALTRFLDDPEITDKFIFNEELQEDVAKVAAACINRTYRDIESSVPRFQKAALMAAEPSRVGRALDFVLRPIVNQVILVILAFLVYLIIKNLAPNFLEPLGYIADILQVLPW